MNRTLIVFGTRRGTTENTALIIGETLVLKYHHKVEVENIRRIRSIWRNLDYFDNIIVGSSIVRKRWKWLVLFFLKRVKFSHQKIALFVVAGGTLNKHIADGSTKKEAIKLAVERYIDSYLPKFNFTPVAKTAFGGVVVQRGIRKYNNWKREDIESWAMQLGKIFEK